MVWLAQCRILGVLLSGLLLVSNSAVFAATQRPRPWDALRRANAREKTRALWYHGFDSYMNNAFPMDELRPLSCKGRGPDWTNQNNIAVNDVNGNFSVTLIDVLDTLVVLQDHEGFDTAVRNVIKHVSFDVDTRPQVFETTIRVLGGLVSGHIFASDPTHGFALPWYKGELLTLALDLGERLLPAFQTGTGMPYARINLRKGVPKGETHETCTAGAGSLILEFATLSRLSGDPRFEKAAFRAFFAIWNLRSDIGLVGNTVNVWTGAWTSPTITTIGAGIDSFFEYALKWHILSGDSQFLDVWNEAYAAVMRYVRGPEGYWYRRVSMTTGDLQYWTLDSLSAFWPGLQVLAGDVENAIKSHLIYWNLWKRFAGLPEVYDINHSVATSASYPLRPEFIESTWYLYRATKDPFYLDVGEKFLEDITIRSKVDCGLTGIEDLVSNKRSDRMESFVLSETLKYLYLLFDDENPLNHDDSNYVLTTEGHILHLNSSNIRPMSAARRKLRPNDTSRCPAYESQPVNMEEVRGQQLLAGIRSSPEYEFGRHLVGIPPTSDLAVDDAAFWTPNGWCDAPKLQQQTFDFIFTLDGDAAVEDPTPAPSKLAPYKDGFVMYNLTGIRAVLRTRLDGKGLDITKLGPHIVRSGQKVYVRDKRLAKQRPPTPTKQRALDVRLSFDVDSTTDEPFAPWTSLIPLLMNSSVLAYTSTFGGDPAAQGVRQLNFGAGSEPLSLVRDARNPMGCASYKRGTIPPLSVILVDRGECSFVQKLDEASLAGAAGVVVINYEDKPLNPSADADDTVVLDGTLDDVALMVLEQQDGEAVRKILDAIEGDETLEVTVRVEGPTDTDEGDEADTPSKKDTTILVVNGHAVMNTVLDV